MASMTVIYLVGAGAASVVVAVQAWRGTAGLRGGGAALPVSGLLFAVTLTAARHLPGRIAAIAQTALAVLVAALVTLVTGGATALAATPPNASWMVGAAAFALLILIPGVMMILHGGNRLESEKVTLLLLLEVPVAMLSAALIAGETMAPFDLAAGALIIAAATIEAWPTAARSATDK